MSEVSPEKGEKLPKTQIIITESRVCALKHSWNKAACVAVSVSMQTFAAIANKLGLVKSLEFKEEGEDVTYDVILNPEEDEHGAIPFIISGVFVALKGIAKQSPNSIEVHDSRKK